MMFRNKIHFCYKNAFIIPPIISVTGDINMLFVGKNIITIIQS